MTRSEDLAARMARLCLSRQIAFAAAACGRARPVFAMCHGATPVSMFDDALVALWNAIRSHDLSNVAAIFRPFMDVPESCCDDTLTSDWLAWLALATFEFPASLISTTRLPLQALAQCSTLMLTLTGEIDNRLGWSGAPRGGALARAEWEAQERCLAILEVDPSNHKVPVAELEAAGADLVRTIVAAAPELARATGWRVWPATPAPVIEHAMIQANGSGQLEAGSGGQ